MLSQVPETLFVHPAPVEVTFPYLPVVIADVDVQLKHVLPV